MDFGHSGSTSAHRHKRRLMAAVQQKVQYANELGIEIHVKQEKPYPGLIKGSWVGKTVIFSWRSILDKLRNEKEEKSEDYEMVYENQADTRIILINETRGSEILEPIGETLTKEERKSSRQAKRLRKDARHLKKDNKRLKKENKLLEKEAKAKARKENEVTISTNNGESQCQELELEIHCNQNDL